jgi:hypothetical protein
LARYQKPHQTKTDDYANREFGLFHSESPSGKMINPIIRGDRDKGKTVAT